MTTGIARHRGKTTKTDGITTTETDLPAQTTKIDTVHRQETDTGVELLQNRTMTDVNPETTTDRSRHRRYRDNTRLKTTGHRPRPAHTARIHQEPRIGNTHQGQTIGHPPLGEITSSKLSINRISKIGRTLQELQPRQTMMTSGYYVG